MLGQTGTGRVTGKFFGEREISVLYHQYHTVSSTLTNTVTPSSTLHFFNARGVSRTRTAWPDGNMFSEKCLEKDTLIRKKDAEEHIVMCLMEWSK